MQNKISLGLNNFITVLAYGFFISMIFIIQYNIFAIIDLKVTDIKNVDMSAFIAGSIITLIVASLIAFFKNKYVGEDRHTQLYKVFNFITLVTAVIVVMTTLSTMIYKWIIMENNDVGFWQSVTLLLLSIIAIIVAVSNTFFINKNNIWKNISKYDNVIFNIITFITIIAAFIITDPRGSAMRAKDYETLEKIYDMQNYIERFDDSGYPLSIPEDRKLPQSIKDFTAITTDYRYRDQENPLEGFTFEVKTNTLKFVKEKNINGYYDDFNWISGEYSYKICADFKTEDKFEGEAQYWNHGKGKACFENTVRAYNSALKSDKNIYPQSEVKDPKVNDYYRDNYSDSKFN